MTNLPKQYAWLDREPGPRILLEALKTYGTAEQPGPGSNPSIMAWAKATGMDRFYTDDATPWCGLALAYCALQAGWPLPVNPLWARNWLEWGDRAASPRLGDVMVFERGKGGHVALYVGEDPEAFHCIGGNHSDRVSIKRISRARLLGARRCPWRVNQPANVRRVVLASTGALSSNEQ